MESGLSFSWNKLKSLLISWTPTSKENLLQVLLKWKGGPDCIQRKSQYCQLLSELCWTYVYDALQKMTDFHYVKQQASASAFCACLSLLLQVFIAKWKMRILEIALFSVRKSNPQRWLTLSGISAINKETPPSVYFWWSRLCIMICLFQKIREEIVDSIGDLAASKLCFNELVNCLVTWKKSCNATIKWENSKVVPCFVVWFCRVSSRTPAMDQVDSFKGGLRHSGMQSSRSVCGGEL